LNSRVKKIYSAAAARRKSELFRRRPAHGRPTPVDACGLSLIQRFGEAPVGAANSAAREGRFKRESERRARTEMNLHAALKTFRTSLCILLSLASAACSRRAADAGGDARPKDEGAQVRASPAPAGEFLQRTVEVRGARYAYQVYVPAPDASGAKRPVLLFLHGSGERGAGPRSQDEVGLSADVMRDASRFPFVAVFPRCKAGADWTDPEMEALALAALDAAVAEFGGDAGRLYLTGVSMGGTGAWHLASRHPGKFAALVPVCGRSPLKGISRDPYGEVARKVGRTPVWIFHGSEDGNVPVYQARMLRDALDAAGGDFKYTEYEGVGHNAWDRAYTDPELWEWLGRQRLSSR
jgi:predicted esterase